MCYYFYIVSTPEESAKNRYFPGTWSQSVPQANILSTLFGQHVNPMICFYRHLGSEINPNEFLERLLGKCEKNRLWGPVSPTNWVELDLFNVIVFAEQVITDLTKEAKNKAKIQELFRQAQKLDITTGNQPEMLALLEQMKSQLLGLNPTPSGPTGPKVEPFAKCITGPTGPTAPGVPTNCCSSPSTHPSADNIELVKFAFPAQCEEGKNKC